MNEVLHAANSMAEKNDHWLFIATLLVFGVATIGALRWLVGKYERLMDQARSDQQGYSTTLLNICAEQNKTARELAVVLARCTDALEDNSTQLRLRREQIERG